MARVLVVYDVSDDRARQKLAEALMRHGLKRIQRSAFAGSLPWSRMKDVAREAEAIIDGSKDVVHIIPLGEREWGSRIVIGTPLWGDVLGNKPVAVV